jgi:GDP-L-fucose synthase
MKTNNSLQLSRDAKIFVAGGTGMVGSAIIRKLLSSGYTNIVSNYNRRHPSSPVTSHPSPVTFVELDLRRQTDTEAFFERERPDHVFLAAAKVGGILANSTYTAEFIYDNIAIGANVIHAAYTYGVKKLLNLGSSCIYPRLAPQPMKEEHLLTGPLEPTNEPYAIAKIAAIKLCRYYNEQYGTNFISGMPANLYGPNDNFDLENSHVLSALIRKFHLGKLLANGQMDLMRQDFLKHGNREIRSGDSRVVIRADSPDEDVRKALKHFGIVESPTPAVDLWGTGGVYREFLHVDDLATACTYLVENYDYREIGEFVNIGTGEDIKVKDLAMLVKEIVGFSGRVEFDLTKPDGMPKKLLDISRIRSLNWRPEIRLEEGIRKVYQSYSSKNGH